MKNRLGAANSWTDKNRSSRAIGDARSALHACVIINYFNPFLFSGKNIVRTDCYAIFTSHTKSAVKTKC